MPSFDSDNGLESESPRADRGQECLAHSQDLAMEQILANINATPIGQVLKKIASLPEVRKEKVLGLRKQIRQGDYDLNERLDVAVDRVLEHLTT